MSLTLYRRFIDVENDAVCLLGRTKVLAINNWNWLWFMIYCNSRKSIKNTNWHISVYSKWFLVNVLSCGIVLFHVSLLLMRLGDWDNDFNKPCSAEFFKCFSCFCFCCFFPAQRHQLITLSSYFTVMRCNFSFTYQEMSSLSAVKYNKNMKS